MASTRSLTIVIVGADLAGMAAAWAATKAGARVTIVRGRAGASAMSSGAWDFVPGTLAFDTRATEMLVDTRAPISFEPSRVVTSAGLVRDASARDLQVLDLKTPCIVPRVPVGKWDADAIAAAVPEARAVDATLVRHRDEMRMPLADFAALHDDSERRDWLVARLHEIIGSTGKKGSILLPPMLGLEPRTFDEIARALGVPIGESLGDPGGPHAIRFTRWRDAMLARLGSELVDGDATRTSQREVVVRGEDGGVRAIACDRVVLAVGGVASGGVVFGTREHEEAGALPASSLAPLRPSIEIEGADFTLHANGSPLDPAASLFGADADRLVLGGTPPLIDVGFRVDDGARVLDRRGRPLHWLFAAGDAVEGRARTALMAVSRGVHAGTSAASVRLD